VLPAFNAAKTLSRTFHEIPLDIVDSVILTDDRSIDNALQIAKELNIQHIISHEKNRGYEIAEISCPTMYFKEASSINFIRSIIYGLGILLTSIKYFLETIFRVNFQE
jgi:hypothetical protein